MLKKTGEILSKFYDKNVDLFRSARKDFRPQDAAYGDFDEIEKIYEMIASLEDFMRARIFSKRYDEEFIYPEEAAEQIVLGKKFIEEEITLLETMSNKYKNISKRVPEPIEDTLKYYGFVDKVLNHVLELQEITEILDKQNSTKQKNKLIPNSSNKKVFIVHGHNEAMKQIVARVLEKLKLEPVILHEQANKGKTIIEKFSENAEVGFAIVLLSPDDFAYPKSDLPKNGKFRARQNVIFELGYFIGRLGREKVLALYEASKNFEMPSDYTGVVFVPYDEHGAWKLQLIKELKAIGIEVNANNL